MTVPASVAVVGYASIDRAMRTGRFQGPAGTTLVDRRLSDPWPGIGGIAYAARCLAGAGQAVRAVTWVGRDHAGTRYREALAAGGVDVTGVVTVGEYTPSAYLFYPPDGSTVCVYDPGDHLPDRLTGGQRGVVQASDWVCLLVGPRPVTMEVLEGLTERQRLAWAVKADPDAYPPELVRRLLARAAVVSFSEAERPFLQRAVAPAALTACLAAGALLVETRGPGGAWFWHGGHAQLVDGRTVGTADTTGAGDTFFGALVAGVIDRADRPGLAVDRGVAAAAALLSGRKDAV